MTNYEKYEQEIKEIILEGNHIGMKNGVLYNCRELACPSCDFRLGCSANRKAWFNAEYKESISLTEREHAFCILFGTGYIVKSEYNILEWHLNKPYKKLYEDKDETEVISYEYWESDSSEYLIFDDSIKLPIPLKLPNFDFVKWEDEPYSIEELLKMPVKESDE